MRGDFSLSFYKEESIIGGLSQARNDIGESKRENHQ